MLGCSNGWAKCHVSISGTESFNQTDRCSGPLNDMHWEKKRNQDQMFGFNSKLIKIYKYYILSMQLFQFNNVHPLVY